MNEQTQNPDELLSAEEAAARLKVARRTLLKWAREGKIGSVKIFAKMIRFTEEQIAEFLTRMTHEMRPEKTGQRSPGTPASFAQLPSKPSRKKQPTQSWKELREEVRSWGKEKNDRSDQPGIALVESLPALSTRYCFFQSSPSRSPLEQAPKEQGSGFRRNSSD